MSTSTDPATLLDALAGHVRVPVVMIDDAAEADGLGRALVAGGLPVAEVTSRSAAAPVVLAIAVADCDASVQLDEPVDGLGAAVVEPLGGDVAEVGGLPLPQGAAQAGDLGDRAGTFAGRTTCSGGGRAGAARRTPSPCSLSAS